MAIYKLGDICEVKMCRRIFNYETNKIGGIPFYKIGTMGKEPDSFISAEKYNEILTNKWNHPKKGDSLISCSGTIGNIVEYNGVPSYFQDSNIVWLETDKLHKKYLYFWLRTNPFLATQSSTIKRLYNSNIKETRIFVPSLNEQQDIIDIIEQNKELFLKFHEIIRIDSKSNCMSDFKNLIDIIEPIETFAELVKKIINKMDSLFRSYSKNGRRTNFNLNELVNFVKGKTVKSTDFKKNGTPFIDVRYLNSAKISKYVDKSPNITYDDILLSLDGSTGIVKTGYSGYNGYVYKVSSTKINNFEIYLNLINDFNQSIISANSVGTTIKHASTAKKIMEYFDYTKYSSSYLLVVKRYFEKLLNTIMQIINKCVTMLIK
jgi:restriction endonuclease S subunit